MFPFDRPVLVVDDMEVVRKVVRAELQKMGFKSILEAGNGVQARKIIIDCAKTIPIQLAILDWNMPELTGIDLLREIRKSPLPTVAKLPVIMLTAEAEMDNVMHAIHAGVNNYL